ncbi:MAG: phosphoenolpyruvate--protein phosphotransferase [Pseudomonadota bacterium]
MRPRPAGPRMLLRRLREVMAEPIRPQDRLDKIVNQIASNMVAEVCSIYVLRSDRVLELFATQGLNPAAVHSASLKMGEGLVGLIASSAGPLNLSDAKSHPAFAYLPETGEEIYNAFLGVPILRAGRTLGVLVVQNKAHRVYTEEEVEALQTIAMVFAEMIVGDELKALLPSQMELDRESTVKIEGLPFADGIGLGHVVLHEPRVVVTNLISEDSNTEIQRLDKALNELRMSVDNMLNRRDIAASGEHRDVLEAYRMFAYDRGWVRKMEEAIDNGLTAEAAVEKVQSDTRARMMRQSDPYLKERLHDFDDLAYRLLRELMGRPHGGSGDEVFDVILVARSMGAADLLDYDPQRVRGLVLEEGAPTSHVVIVARALGIPTVGEASDILSYVDTGDGIIVDGDLGEVQVRPPADVEAAYADKVRFRAKRQERYAELLDIAPVTRDGTRIQLLLNAGLGIDLENLQATNADGIGLFRTELQFMIASNLPRLTQQQDFYEAVLKKAGDKPVTFRILDIGGDKILPYMRMGSEENPAMGWRAIRLGLDRPGLFRVQVRAMINAARDRELRIMVPMVTEVSEAEAARELVQKEIAQASRHGRGLPSRVHIGVMIEVPSLLWQLPELMKVVDFVSVGSNDLIQFLTACDRSNTKLSARYDVLSKANVSALKAICDEAGKAGVPITLCGEMGGRPLEALVLLGLGYRALSMNPSSIGPVKAMVVETNLEALAAKVEELLATPGLQSLREPLEHYVAENNIPIH